MSPKIIIGFTLHSLIPLCLNIYRIERRLQLTRHTYTKLEAIVLFCRIYRLLRDFAYGSYNGESLEQIFANAIVIPTTMSLRFKSVEGISILKPAG